VEIRINPTYVNSRKEVIKKKRGKKTEGFFQKRRELQKSKKTILGSRGQPKEEDAEPSGGG